MDEMKTKMEAAARKAEDLGKEWVDSDREMKEKIMMIEANVTMLTQELMTIKNKSSDRDFSPKKLTEGKGFMTLKEYDGNSESYDDWSFKAFLYINGTFPIFEKVTKTLESMNEEITEEQVKLMMTDFEITKEEYKHFDEQLYLVLAAKTTSHILTTVKNLKGTTAKNIVGIDSIRGLVAWHRIQIAAIGKNKVRVQQLAQKIMSPDQVKKYEDIPEALQSWELLLREFEASSEYPLDSAIKLGALKKMMPSELEADLMRMEITDFQKVKDYVMSQAMQRRQPYFEPSSKELAKKSPLANLEEDEEPKEAFAVQGQGQFQGTCHHCGKWGHRISDCFQKDAQMKGGKGDGGKGKGKDFGSGGKGYGKVKGFYGGYKGGDKGKGKGKGWTPYGKGAYGGQQPQAYSMEYWGEGQADPNWNMAMCLEHVVPTVETKVPMVTRKAKSVTSKGLVTQIVSETITRNRFQGLTNTEEENILDEESWPTPAMRTEDKDKETTRSDNGKKKKMVRFQKEKTQKDVKKERAAPTDEAARPKLQMEILAAAGAKKKKKEKEEDNACESFVGIWTAEVEDETVECQDCEAFYLEEFESPDSAMNVTNSKELVWVQVKSIMDTGCAKSVAPPSLASHIPIMATEDSKRGAEFQTAGGGKLANQGSRVIPAFTGEWQPVDMTYAVADVVKPLNAVSQICDRGNEVTFTATGGYIWNRETNNVVEFPRERGVYVLETWVQMPLDAARASGFTRQER